MLRVLIFLGFAVFALTVVTQVILPAVRNQPLFPLFNKRRQIAVRRLEEAKAQAFEARLEAEAERARAEAAETSVGAQQEVNKRLDSLIEKSEGTESDDK